ncbi:hypothetical protein [Solibacillus isronensis]|uniref:hypothetical protein n=1 Tax=Solibacillus isronensis TaxID=412383 RepID=UPI0039A387F3
MKQKYIGKNIRVISDELGITLGLIHEAIPTWCMENAGDSGGMNHSSDGEIPEGMKGATNSK